MNQIAHDVNRLSGQYLIQDSDHLSDRDVSKAKASRGVRQSDQTQAGGRQQGGSDSARQAGRRRQAH